jgi:hypothetical protein
MMDEQQFVPVPDMDSAIMRCYEGLRRAALGSAWETGRELGLALFVRQGMTSWMQAWSKWGIREAAVSQIKKSPEGDPLIPLNREAVMILASMALSGRYDEARQ